MKNTDKSDGFCIYIHGMGRGAQLSEDRGRPITLSEFEATVALHHSRLLALAQSIVGRPEEAEEVVQSSLVRVWQRVAAGEVRELQHYLFHAVRLNALQHRARRKKHASLTDLDLPAPERAEDTAALMALEPDALEAAVAELPDRQRTVIRLKYYVGLTFREIGENLRISSHTAASACRYALKALRRRLKPGLQREEFEREFEGDSAGRRLTPRQDLKPGESE